MMVAVKRCCWRGMWRIVGGVSRWGGRGMGWGDLRCLRKLDTKRQDAPNLLCSPWGWEVVRVED